MLKVFISLFLFMSTAAFAADYRCVEGEIRQTVQGIENVRKSSYCYAMDMSEIVSKNCRKQNCSAYRVGKRYYAKELLSRNGTPGFRLCRELGGEPEILSFLAEDTFHETDRCAFPDGAFVSTDSLMDFYLDRSSPEE